MPGLGWGLEGPEVKERKVSPLGLFAVVSETSSHHVILAVPEIAT